MFILFDAYFLAMCNTLVPVPDQGNTGPVEKLGPTYITTDGHYS